MKLVNKVLISVILMCAVGVVYVSYKFIRFMEVFGLSEPAKAIKEMMFFFVYIILFGLIMSVTGKLLMKLRKYTKEDK